MADEGILHHELGSLIILFRDFISELEQSSKSCPTKLLNFADTAVFYRGVRIWVKVFFYSIKVLLDLGYRLSA